MRAAALISRSVAKRDESFPAGALRRRRQMPMVRFLIAFKQSLDNPVGHKRRRQAEQAGADECRP